MRMLHDATTCQALVTRIEGLRPESGRAWGRMSIDQMLWHVNQGLLSGLGELEVPPTKVPLPTFLLKPLVLNLPWPKGAPTAPAFEARATHDFARERERLLQLIRAFSERPLRGTWPRHTGFGAMTGRQWSRLMYRHLDHHLRQFSA